MIVRREAAVIREKERESESEEGKSRERKRLSNGTTRGVPSNAIRSNWDPECTFDRGSARDRELFERVIG